MTLRLKRQFLMIVCGVAGTALLGVTLGYGEADEPGKPGEAAVSASEADAASPDVQAPRDKKPRAKSRRLPTYYARVVDAGQREQIYTVQQAYAKQIEPLRQQLAELDEQLRAEVRAVLSDEQRQEVDELMATARSRREAAKAKRDAARSAESDSATDESAADE